MFQIRDLQDTIKVEAEDLQNDRASVIKMVINKKYSNKVLPNVGFCIAVFGIHAISEGMILHQDGCFYHKVIFQLLVFRPSISECIEARILSCSEQGLKLTTRFFDEIRVPADFMLDTSVYDSKMAMWFWNPNFQLEESLSTEELEHYKTLEPVERKQSFQKLLLKTPEDERYYISNGEIVRIRVENEFFHDTGPVKPPKANLHGAAAVPLVDEQVETIAPYRIVAKMNEEGLGVLGWWRGDEQADQEMRD